MFKSMLNKIEQTTESVSIPHDFSEILETSDSPPAVFFCGSGLSCKLVDSVGSLVEKCEDAARSLNCGILERTPENKDQYLYLWAEDIEGQLKNANEPFPKLRIAESLGLLDDEKWLGNTATRIPLSKHSARHRIIARFAREKIWKNLWTLNWDCFLEKALQCTGFVNSTENGIERLVPWPVHYKTRITLDDAKNLNDEIVIFKPNGCANALHNATNEIVLSNEAKAQHYIDRFLVTQSELTARDKSLPLNQSFWSNLYVDLENKRLVVVGWSMSEWLMSYNSLHEGALKLAAQGLKVHPLKAKEKVPNSNNGFKDASSDPEQLAAWFGGTDCNIGVRTGNGLVVIDFDPRNGGLESHEEIKGDLPETLRVNTSGGGFHLYFQSDEPIKSGTNVLGNGIDVKAEGG
ncbi:MAG: bifunctional DNA primase/polymerase [Rickettsiales bacterium]|nr:bifunctional DNA primase/polymerase [Rickettsiales bacterium]